MMMKPITIVAAVLLGAWLAPVVASEGNEIRMEPAPINRLDVASLQRGARTFVNYCLNCHSAKYMRYNRLTDLGIDLSMIEDNLMFATKKVGETMNVAMTPADARAWFGTPPPDLTVESRVRGVDWLYNYFLGFYKDDASATGWNNIVFPNVGMPHALWQLSGPSKLVTTEYANHDDAIAGVIAAKRLARFEPLPGGRAAVLTLDVDGPGALREDEYRAVVADLVNYMDYMGEPIKNKRINIGLVALLYLIVLLGFAYWTKREYWKDVH